MEHLFFNLPAELEEAAVRTFNAIGATSGVLEGDSVNVLGGIYYVYTVFGVVIKIELNCYDWDDTYKFMVSIKKSVLSNIETTEENIATLAKIICDLLYRNLKTEIAIEVGDELVLYNPSPAGAGR
jgi:hypothetical protein